MHHSIHKGGIRRAFVGMVLMMCVAVCIQVYAHDPARDCDIYCGGCHVWAHDCDGGCDYYMDQYPNPTDCWVTGSDCHGGVDCDCSHGGPGWSCYNFMQ